MRVLVAAGLLVTAAVLGPTVASAAGDSPRTSGAPTGHSSQLGRTNRDYMARALAHRSTPKPVTIKAEVGYDGQYRGSGWVPVRVTITNHTQQDVTGQVQIPQSGQNNGPSVPYRGLYEVAVTLPAGSTKRVTLYVPSTSNGGEVHVRFIGIGGIKASYWVYANVQGTWDLTVGALSGGPADISWLRNLNIPIGVDIARLSPATLDPIPAVLADFDVIALTNVDASRLDAEQFSALRQYVRNGGTLLLVGGPNWQETLHPLPAWLVPGTLSGSVTVPDLSGLSGVASAPSLPRARTTLSSLTHVRGTIVAYQGTTPLVVQEQLGSGTIEYLAFDPAVRPVAGWSHASTFLGRLLSQAAAPALGRASAQGGSPVPGFQGCAFQGCGYGAGIGTELANIPSAALPSLILFVALTILYIILLGPANYLVLRKLRRLELSWISIPILGVLCVALTFSVAYRLKGSTVLVNTISFVPLDGSGAATASMYVGLFAPVRGDYQLNLDGTGLPAMVPNFDYSPGPASNSVGVRFDEGARTDISLLSMNMWSSRAVALDTTLHVPGTVHSDLWVDARGNIVGTVRNGTNLLLRDPAILAGVAVRHLPDIPAGTSVRVYMRPNGDIFTRNRGVTPVYGIPSYGQAIMSGPALPFIPGFGIQSQCCYGPGLPAEKTFRDRVRNAFTSLPESQSVSTMGEVVLVGWSDAPLGRFTVDGATPNRRDLTMVAAPLSIRLPSGPFRLRSGTIGARLTDMVPATSSNGCCCCGPIPNALDIGSGGWATFRFDIPRAHKVHFRRLTLWVNAGGADGEKIGSVYDWRSRAWRKADLSFGSFDLHNPDRFVSAQGALLVRLAPTASSHDVRIVSPYWDLQLVGSGVAS